MDDTPAAPHRHSTIEDFAFLADLRDLVDRICRAPENRMGAAFFREHVEIVEHFVLRLAPLFGAELRVVVPAAILHDIAAIEDFSRVSEHHILGARRAEDVLASCGIEQGRILSIGRCVELHVRPVDPTEHGPEAACLSHADALAQMANPAFWIHYAGTVRGLDFQAARGWYGDQVRDRWSCLSESVKPLARPFADRALDACRDAREFLRPPVRTCEDTPCS